MVFGVTKFKYYNKNPKFEMAYPKYYVYEIARFNFVRHRDVIHVHGCWDYNIIRKSLSDILVPGQA